MAQYIIDKPPCISFRTTGVNGNIIPSAVENAEVASGLLKVTWRTCLRRTPALFDPSLLPSTSSALSQSKQASDSERKFYSSIGRDNDDIMHGFGRDFDPLGSYESCFNEEKLK